MSSVSYSPSFEGNEISNEESNNALSVVDYDFNPKPKPLTG